MLGGPSGQVKSETASPIRKIGPPGHPLSRLNLPAQYSGALLEIGGQAGQQRAQARALLWLQARQQPALDLGPDLAHRPLQRPAALGEIDPPDAAARRSALAAQQAGPLHALQHLGHGGRLHAEPGDQLRLGQAVVRRQLDDVWGSLVRGIQPPAGETATGRVAAMRAPGELAREAASRRSIRLATGEAGLAMARRFVARATVAAGWEDHVDDVALLASELATNAVLHGERPIAVAVEAGGHRLRVEVSDAAPALPVELDLGPEIENGRGLAIVEAVADEWGAERVAGDGKVVWAELRDDDGAEPGAGKDGR